MHDNTNLYGNLKKYHANAIIVCAACAANERYCSSRCCMYDNDTYLYYLGILKIFDRANSRFPIMKLRKTYPITIIASIIRRSADYAYHELIEECTQLIAVLQKYEEKYYNKLILGTVTT